MKSIRLLLLLAVAAVCAITPFSHTTAQRGSDVEKRIDGLMARMTLAEKLGQLQQLDGEGNGSFRPEHLELIRKGLLGLDSERPRRAREQINCSAWPWTSHV